MKEPNIPAGNLSQKISIEQKTPGQQDPATGDISFTWTTFVGNVPAGMEPLTAREMLLAQQMQALVTVKCTIRYMPGILPTMRIVHLGVVYDIAGILPDSTYRRFIILMLSAGLNQG